MKLAIVFTIVLACCVALVFLVKHHRRTLGIARACTLGEFYLEFFRDVPQNLTPRTRWFLWLGVAGVFAAFYPAAFVLLLRLHHVPGNAGGFGFFLGGVLALLGTAANFLGIVLSHLRIGWGAGANTDKQPFQIWFILVFQILFAVASVAVGVSATCSDLFGRLVF